mmetsp:Transcript_12928/g.14562  ORF Transcript_12928/g.14562 Transcript_12928/m.14562 type:complete len:144 (-) Transcript_12928:22-453(-)
MDGTYTAIWTPPRTGEYQVFVMLSGVSAEGSPFTVNVKAPLYDRAITMTVGVSCLVMVWCCVGFGCVATRSDKRKMMSGIDLYPDSNSYAYPGGETTDGYDDHGYQAGYARSEVASSGYARTQASASEGWWDGTPAQGNRSSW